VLQVLHKPGRETPQKYITNLTALYVSRRRTALRGARRSGPAAGGQPRLTLFTTALEGVAMPTELREGVWWVECTGVNAYLVDDGTDVTLVDAGSPFDAARIEAAIGEAGFARADVDRILITHFDFDHVGAAAALTMDAPIYVGSADADYVTGDRRPSLSGVKPLIQLLSGPIVRDVPADRVHPIEDGDEIGGFRAVHTPGHTPGHTAYLHEDLAAAFVGDAVMERKGSLRPSPWFLSYDVEAVEESIRTLAASGVDAEVVAMGHGTPFGRRGGDRLRDAANRL
jgi:glyoxylase-like metal-dependent hydrolase (beta-lactamase superfamily II)